MADHVIQHGPPFHNPTRPTRENPILRSAHDLSERTHEHKRRARAAASGTCLSLRHLSIPQGSEQTNTTGSVTSFSSPGLNVLYTNEGALSSAQEYRFYFSFPRSDVVAFPEEMVYDFFRGFSLPLRRRVMSLPRQIIRLCRSSLLQHNYSHVFPAGFSLLHKELRRPELLRHVPVPFSYLPSFASLLRVCIRR